MLGQGDRGQPVEPMDGVEAGGEVDRAGRQQRAVKRAAHRAGKNARGEEAAAPRLLEVGEQLVEVVAGQVAVDRLKGLVGAPPEAGDDGPHQADGVAALRGAQVQDGDRPRGGRQRQTRDGVVHPILEGLDRGELHP